MLKNLRNKLNEKKNKKGFTLIELIIVIAIIAILAALLLPKIGAVKENSNKTSDIANGKKVAESVLALSADDKLTPSDTVWVTLGATGDGTLVSNYIQSTPKGKSSSVKNGDFSYLLKTDGTVEVKIGSQKVYPTPSSVFDAK